MDLKNNLEIIIDEKNKRLKVFDYDKDIKSLSSELINIAEDKDLDKIIVFSKEQIETIALKSEGFIQEGKIDGFYDGEDALLFSKYLNQERKTADNLFQEDRIIQTITNNLPELTAKEHDEQYLVRNAAKNDIPEITHIFETVFKTYPTPMHDEHYVKKIMNNNVDIAVVESEDGIVSVSSAEIDYVRNNAEITDCATLPAKRSLGHINRLINFLENNMKNQGIVNLFSIARARSFGMNKVLHNLNYKYRGRLINNVHIAGSWENMNIWVKQL